MQHDRRGSYSPSLHLSEIINYLSDNIRPSIYTRLVQSFRQLITGTESRNIPD